MRRTEYKTTLSRAALGLAAGIFAAVLLVLAMVLLRVAGAAAQGRHLLFPAEAQAWIAGTTAFYFAIVVSIASLPIWFVLSSPGLRGWRSAAALGFLMTLSIWLADNLADGASSLPTILGDGLLWAALGGVSGLVVWRTAYRRAPSRSAMQD
jgi:hypothetical protein